MNLSGSGRIETRLNGIPESTAFQVSKGGGVNQEESDKAGVAHIKLQLPNRPSCISFYELCIGSTFFLYVLTSHQVWLVASCFKTMLSFKLSNKEHLFSHLCYY